MPSYSHLSTWEREQLAALKAAGASGNSMARALGRSPATISRELRRNRLPCGGYSPRQADGAYLERRRRDAILESDRRLRQFVTDRLAEGWSPEQIAGWLKRNTEPKLRTLVTETIYAFIYRAAQQPEKLWRYLVRRRTRRRPLRARPSRDTIKNRRSIHDRPASAADRNEVGHWEADLIICKHTRPVLVLHERKTRITLATRMSGKTAAETISSMMAIFRRVDPSLRGSVTFDNDTTFARHGLLTDLFGMSTWFCDAYASWQKGGIENANGRLRRWLPRWLDIDAIDEADLQDAIITLNTTPRKCLGFITPFQALLKELGKDVQIRFS
ncbi:IS30 family transposase [Aurantimonas sp. A3-2-R12]|uniref:IS30 family transposase n=1 Tax=Aurantimonas sp. A3-2-R12 TaxID=3114362 RepID=UPI002E16B810|nr:IS30 family transposase [Aurantimonas sp. A3-2-R12]